ncbi:MAG: hypothetical protein ACI8XB_002639 [Patiriisocius sp.]|jgi:hypothetical protein
MAQEKDKEDLLTNGNKTRTANNEYEIITLCEKQRFIFQIRYTTTQPPKPKHNSPSPDSKHNTRNHHSIFE